MTENKKDITYKDVLKNQETLNDHNAVFAQWTRGYKDNEERKKAAEEILLQPYMEDVYKAHDIRPEDVKEFIETVKESRIKCENVIFNNSNAFQQNKDNSRDMDGDGRSDGDENKIDTYEEYNSRKRQLTKAFEKIMKPFAKQKAMERSASDNKKTWFEKALRKGVKVAGSIIHTFAVAGGVALIAGGSYMGIKMSMNENENNNNNNSFGITPTQYGKAKQNFQKKIDSKTNYDAFSKAEKKTPAKESVDIRQKGGIERS